MHVITSVDNYVVCKECGLKILYSEDLSLQTDNELFKFKYIKVVIECLLLWKKSVPILMVKRRGF